MLKATVIHSPVLKFEGGWHGGHDVGQLSAAPANPPPFPAADFDCDGIPASAAADTLVAPFNDLDATREIIETHAREIAAVIVEPLQRAIKPEPGFLDGLRKLTQQYGIVLIYDEIVTGFRLAWGGAQERYGVVPDLACYGKAMAGGYPLSAVVGRADILAAADPRRKGQGPYCFLSGTLTGNPVAAAAGLAALGVLEELGVYDRLHEIGNTLRGGINEIARKLGEPIQAIGDGPVLQVLFTQQPLRNWRDCLKADGKKAVRFGYELIRRGVYCSPGGKIYLSLAHSNDDLQIVLGRVEQALSAVRV
jgi:glutamate-1-semialdehyde 2,1-aminomutase